MDLYALSQPGEKEQEKAASTVMVIPTIRLSIIKLLFLLRPASFLVM